MSTIPCTVEEFNAAFCQFHDAIGFTHHSQEGIANMHKCLVLHYLGIEGATDEEIEKCATWLMVATNGAIRRGWDLEVPDLSITA